MVNEYTELTKEEYYDWFRHVDEIVEQERCIFSSCCGPHEFSTLVDKGGTLYELIWGWDIVHGKTEYAYRVETLYKRPNQDGDGI